jgi:hypothetical protein
MEEVIKALIATGPAGVLNVILILGFVALWMAYQTSLKDVKRCVEALTLSAAAIKSATDGRDAVIQSNQAVVTLLQTLLGRIERVSSFIEFSQEDMLRSRRERQ